MDSVCVVLDNRLWKSKVTNKRPKAFAFIQRDNGVCCWYVVDGTTELGRGTTAVVAWRNAWRNLNA